MLTNNLLVDFALTEAAYIIVRILQRFLSIRLLKNVMTEVIDIEKQTVTLVMSVTEGCMIDIK